jgi:hypothetical protein
MKLKNTYLFVLEYEVPPSFDSWKTAIAAANHTEAQGYVNRYWGKPCNFISVGMEKAIDALSDSVLKQIMARMAPKTQTKGQPKPIGQKTEKKPEIKK